MFHLVIGTPMYGGMCTSEYTQSLLDLTNAVKESGNHITSIFLGNESLIQRGRNTIAHHFLNSNASHLLFIDADIKFRAQDVGKMIMADKELIIGPVPLKGIDWEQVRLASLSGKDNLYAHTGIFNINHLPEYSMNSENEPFEIEHGGGAFMMIRRDAFEKLIPHTPTYTNGGRSIAPGEEVFDFFRVEISQEKRHLLSEDYFFCESYRKIGGKVWCAPWVKTVHQGTFMFNGEYSATFGK